MPAEDGPRTLEDYKHWFRAAHDYDEVLARKDYDFAGPHIREALRRHPFWTGLATLAADSEAEYQLRTTYPLFAGRPDGNDGSLVPELAVKPYESLLDKTWRKNYLDNPSWPDPPPISGWITPSNWYEQVADIVRTTFVVKYLDGVIAFQGKLRDHADGQHIDCQTELAARHEGHYAAHVDISFPVELPVRPWGTQKITARAEIQITTQLQDAIARLLHRQYESSRIGQSTTNWEWDFRGEAFHVNYLGHVLHYLEGMIMDERERGSNGSI